MTIMNRRHVLVGLLGAAMSVQYSLTATAAEDLTLGALYPFSGSLAVLGEESFRGTEMAVEERNAAGGINGRKIVLAKGDAVDNNQAVGEARRLLSVENVSAIIGTYSSSRSFAASQVAELAGIPYFELGAISDPITERGFKYVFRTNPTARGFAMAAVDGIPNAVAPGLGVEPESLRIAIIHEDSLYGQTVAGFQKERVEELGLNLVEVLPYSAKSVDLSSVILRLKGSDVDVVLQTSYQNDTVLFFKQSDELGFKPKAAIGAGGGYSLKDTVDAVGADIMEGALNVDFTQYQTNPEAAPGVEKFPEMYQKKYGTPPRSGHSLTNYFGAQIVFDILAAAESTSGDDVRAAALKVDLAEGNSPTGWGVRFDESGQNTRAAPMLMQWQGGELLTVHPKAAAVADLKVGLGK